jgi:dolichyl-phosphate beta-glucosyltransferase
MISIILPAFNEAGRLPACLDLLNVWTGAQPEQFEVIVVPNGCTDDTTVIAINHGLDFQDNVAVRVIPIRTASKGLAVLKGMQIATGNIRLMADVDLACRPPEWRSLIELIEIGAADIAIASRYMPGASAQIPVRRRMAGKVFHAITSPLVGNIHDTQCGFKAFSAKAANRLFYELRLTGWAFDVELLYLARRYGFRVAEIPVAYTADLDSRINLLRDAFRMAYDVVRIPGLHPM